MSSVEKTADIRPTLQHLEGSKIREVANLGASVKNALPLWFGEPDAVTPDFIRAAAKQALDAGETFYGPNLGLPRLREAIAAYLTRHGRPVDSQRVCVTASGVNALMLSAQTVLEPGDRVVLPTPHWPNLAEITRVIGARPATVPLSLRNGLWQADIGRLIDAITPDTRLVILNSPANPTGWTLTRDEQRALLDHCRKIGAWILADEVYERIYFDADAAPSFLEIAEPEDRVLGINSFSKSWAMTGWRLGWIVAPPHLMDTLAKLTEYNVSCATTFVQHAGIAAIEGGDQFIADNVARYRQMRDLVAEMIGGLPRITMPLPRGAMYAFFRVDGVADSLAFAKDLLVKTGVGLAPGAAFGPAGEGYLRLCYAVSRERLTEACGRFRAFMETAGRY